jgi:hypothetical protein
MRRSGRHVACVLFVARAIGDNEVAVRTMEIAVSDINRYTLLTLCIQTVSQERKIQDIAIGVLKTALAPQCFDLIIGKHASVVKQTPQQGALAVIDASAGYKTQKAALGVIVRHQK